MRNGTRGPSVRSGHQGLFQMFEMFINFTNQTLVVIGHLTYKLLKVTYAEDNRHTIAQGFARVSNSSGHAVRDMAPKTAQHLLCNRGLFTSATHSTDLSPWSRTYLLCWMMSPLVFITAFYFSKPEPLQQRAQLQVAFHGHWLGQAAPFARPPRSLLMWRAMHMKHTARGHTGQECCGKRISWRYHTSSRGYCVQCNVDLRRVS